MKNKILLIVGIFLTFNVLSQNYISSNLYDYLFYEGSFWVYEQEETNTIDSLIVTEVIHGFNPEVWIHGVLVLDEVEYYQMFYESITLAYQTWDQLIGYVIVREGVDWGNNGQYIFLSSYQIGDETGGAKIVDTMNTYSVNSLEFHDVTKIFIESNYIEDSKPTHYYYSKDVGIIRKEILSLDTTQILEAWNLINWNVNQSSNIIINDLEDANIEIYPNPASNHLHLRFTGRLKEKLILNIRDITGRLVFNLLTQENELDIDISNLKEGIYMVDILYNENRKVYKIIIK
jgi:hypothetical protein